MNFIILLINFFLGSCFASHAAVICDDNQPFFILRRSKCAYCLNELSLLDEIPLISYLVLHGKCRFCHEPIPLKLFVTEFIGGFAYSNLKLNQSINLLTGIFIFVLLLIAIQDYEQSEFTSALLLPLIFLIINKIICFPLNYRLDDYTELIPIALLLFYFTLTQKLGSGDLIIYLILALYFDPHFANLVLLFASFIFIIQSLLENQLNSKQKSAFVPYLFLGLTIQLLLN